MSFGQSYSFQNLLKEGHRHFSGLEEALLKNITACQEISNITKTSLGPNGMKQMVINHIDKQFVTSDAATIMRELEVQHPAAKMIVMASKMQETECGDATNFVIAFAGELLNQAEALIKMGLHPSQIVSGYEDACKQACILLETSPELIKGGFTVDNILDKAQISKAVFASLSSKLTTYAEFFSGIVADACIQSCPPLVTSFEVDHIRVVKILGSNVNESRVHRGLIVLRNAEGSIAKVTKPKIAVYGCPLDPNQGDTKSTVLIKNANELLNYSKTEEDLAEKIVRKIAESGVNLVVVGGTISELMLHFVEKYKMMIVKVTSKFEVKRICKAVGATLLARLDAPTPEEIGECDEVKVEEIGSQRVTVFLKENDECKLNTIVLRGSTNNFLDDIERAIDDSVNVFRNLISEQRFVPGAGATEAILSAQLQNEAKKIEDLNQYSYNKYALSFQIIPRILAENAGLDINEILPQINSANLTEPHGIEIQTGQVRKSTDLKVYDHMRTKWWAIKLATDAAITILQVDQIIIAKPAGGPQAPKQNGNWDNDE